VVKGSKPIRRHLVQFVHEKWNSDLGKTEKCVVNATITNDPGSTFTSTDLLHLVMFAREFLTSTRVAQLLRDET